MADEDRDLRWLNGSEQLFRASASRYLNADTGQRRDLGFYAGGYRLSAEMLHEAIQKGGYADSQFFALAFLWRQALELSIKALHEDLGELEQLEVLHGPPVEAGADMQACKPLKGHDLEKLWRAVEPRLRKIFPSEPETDWIRRAISQFHAVDPGAEDFRYPTKLRDGSPTLKALPRTVSFDDLDRDMQSLLNALDGAIQEVRSRIDYIREALAALR